MIKRIIIGILSLLVVIVAGLLIYVQTSWNKVYDLTGPPLEVSADSGVIAKGKYLVHGPAHCSSCHVASYEDMILSDQGEAIPLKGGVKFPLGPLGSIHPPNLTPDPKTGIGRYTDEQLFRMMRHAIKPDGTGSLALMMPFWDMADEDQVAIISYLRSLPPIRNEVPKPEWTFMGKAVRTFAPSFKPVLDPNPPSKAPPMAPTIERGRYLAHSVANCVGCHTERDQMTYEAIGPEFAGGMEFEPFPELYKLLGVDEDVWMRSPNITPDAKGVLANYPTAESWITRFRQGRIINFSPMDWGPFSRMSDEDLEAIWIYLQSLTPVENDVGPLIFKK